MSGSRLPDLAAFDAAAALVYAAMPATPALYRSMFMSRVHVYTSTPCACCT